MINLKKNKGVTLMALTITIIVLLIVAGITINNSKSQLAIKNVNNVYADIESIGTKVSDYYLKNNSLPILENAYFNSKQELASFCTSNDEDISMINANDSGAYYVIDLSKLDNLTLTYGLDYKKWTSSSTSQDLQDIYIINQVTHQIYYPKGIKYNGEKYFTRGQYSDTIEKIDLPVDIADGDIAVDISDAKKEKITGSDKTFVTANIKLTVNADYQKEKLKYAITTSEEGDINYSSFSLDDTNSAKIMSGQVEDTSKYYLYIKVLGTYGEEHIVKKEININ